MTFLLFFILNLLLMAALFAYGFYQFMQVEEKRKRDRLFLNSELDAAEWRALREAPMDEAVARLMDKADVDRYTAERALRLHDEGRQSGGD